MPIWTNALAKPINAKQKRFALVYPRHVKRGHVILIGDELMAVRRCHRDGTITVERGIEVTDPLPHRYMDSALNGDPDSFDLKRKKRRKQ